jgi:hypothetical protein
MKLRGVKILLFVPLFGFLPICDGIPDTAVLDDGVLFQFCGVHADYFEEGEEVGVEAFVVDAQLGHDFGFDGLEVLEGLDGDHDACAD